MTDTDTDTDERTEPNSEPTIPQPAVASSDHADEVEVSLTLPGSLHRLLGVELGTDDVPGEADEDIERALWLYFSLRRRDLTTTVRPEIPIPAEVWERAQLEAEWTVGAGDGDRDYATALDDVLQEYLIYRPVYTVDGEVVLEHGAEADDC